MVRLSKAAYDRRSEHNATHSLLARLPLEVRLMIWTFAVGGHVLHVEVNDICVCQCATTPDEEYFNWKTALTSRSDNEVSSPAVSPFADDDMSPSRFYYDHDTCGSSRDRRRLPRLYGKGMLRSCKLIYYEIDEIFWTTNMFSIQDSRTFESFMGGLSMKQKQSLTNLHLRGDFGSRWRQVLPEHLIACLSGLKRFQVSVTGIVVNSLFSSRGQSIVTILECLSRFKVLPIEHCTIVIEEAVGRNARPNSKLTYTTKSSTQCLTWSERLQKNILAPCETEEERKERMAVALAQQVCRQSSTKHDCWMLFDRFMKNSDRWCRKVHVCLVCWETHKTADIWQRYEAAKKCASPGSCQSDSGLPVEEPAPTKGESDVIRESTLRALPTLEAVS